MSQRREANSSENDEIREDHDAPCNICGRGWPYHAEACAYKQARLENQRLRDAEQRLEKLIRAVSVECARTGAPSRQRLREACARAEATA